MQRLIRGTAPVAVMLLLAACGGGDWRQEADHVCRRPHDLHPDHRRAARAQGGILDAAGLSQRRANHASDAGTVGLAMAGRDWTRRSLPSSRNAKAQIAASTRAPEEIRDDFKVVTDYARGLGEVLARYPMKAGQHDPAAMAALVRNTESVHDLEKPG